MKFGVYCVRDIKSGFQTPTAQVNDQIAMRGFASAVMNDNGILATHSADFSLYKIGEFDSDKGRLFPLDLPYLLIEASEVNR